MGMFDRIIGNAIASGVNKVAREVTNQAANQVIKNVKDSGVIQSTIDDAANKITGGTKYAKIMKCPFCGREYDNTEELCPGCGAANENRKYEYSKQQGIAPTVAHMLNVGDKVTDGNLTFEILGVSGDKYKVKDSFGGTALQKIETLDGCIQEGSFHKC